MAKSAPKTGEKQAGAKKQPAAPRKKRTATGQFSAGHTGNPNGRPKKGETFDSLFQEHMSKADLVGKLAGLARKGDRTSVHYAIDRLWGKPTQEIKVSSDVELDAPIHIHIAGAQIEFSSDDSEADDGE